ncbi:CinA family protein [Desertimonas flava]|uniref:CinA family protein n=1 Tax=Desertimonas flava TaxID=2064846 RepID=UPI001D0CA417|nr:CinA family protein [Desertimonas flava]
MARRLAGRQVATAESCTAGRVSTALACADDAQSFLRGGLVSYQVQTKRRLLHVDADSVLSSEAAVEMAVGACHHLHADVAVATTGLAGGEPQDGVEVGTVFIATCVSGRTAARRYRFDGDPLEVCDAATRQALIDLARALRATENGDIGPSTGTVGTRPGSSEPTADIAQGVPNGHDALR